MNLGVNWTLDSYATLFAACIVLFLGHFLIKKVKLLDDFNIPVPVAGGLVIAIVVLILHEMMGFTLDIDKNLQNALMLMFFTSIGLSADFSRLRAGGFPLIIFLVVVSVLILIQNIVGVTLATLFDLKPLTGLITGSITLTGGHGTAIGWGQVLDKQLGSGASELGIACATFGLVLGGLIGGPVARRLIVARKLTVRSEDLAQSTDNDDGKDLILFEDRPRQKRLITVESALETLAMFAVCLVVAELLSVWFNGLFSHPASEETAKEGYHFNFTIPTFVWALGVGVIVRNTLSKGFNYQVFDRCVDIYGNVSLSLFLAMALMSLKLWELSGLALPVLVILAVQTVVMILYAYFVTFRVMGKDYDAAVLAAGHCGFGLGATPTAVANMQAVTDRFGPSHKAFLIVPMVGAFFVDIVNATILSIFMALPFLH